LFVIFSECLQKWVGAILKILCPWERRVFQSKLGVSSSNQCNLHHSPHTGHLEKKNKKWYNLFRTRYICIPDVSTTGLGTMNAVNILFVNLGTDGDG
jgi:hypothetical protein